MDFILTNEGAVEDACLICALELVPWGHCENGLKQETLETGRPVSKLMKYP